MTNSFNLITEPWIPCIWLSGKYEELSIIGIFSNAHEIREINDNSPLVTASLHRFLLAILHRVLGPKDLDIWYEIYKQKQFDDTKLKGYLNEWKDHFDLLHPQFPFYQSLDKDVQDSVEHPPCRLAQELSSGNNDTLFDHSNIKIQRPWSFSQSARYLITTQNYSVGGGVSKPFNLSHAPLVRGNLVLLKSSTLFESLLFNLIRYSKNSPKQLPSSTDDIPHWEKTKQDNPSKRGLRGYLDLLTFQSRRILLIQNNNNEIKSIKIQQRDAINDESYLDPQICYIKKDKNKGFMPLRFSESKSFWRDSLSLISSSLEMSKNPDSIKQLGELIFLYPEIELVPITMDVLGFKPDNKKAAKINLWRHERYPLPFDYLKDDFFIGVLHKAIETSEGVSDKLYQVIRKLASNLLVPFNLNESTPDKDRVNKLVKNFPGSTYYWSNLENPFINLYLKIPDDPDVAISQWEETLRKVVWDSLELTLNTLDNSARSMQASVQARRHLGGLLKSILRKEEVNTSV
jgi:CRISPR system Cascade subunit CasA